MASNTSYLFRSFVCPLVSQSVSRPSSFSCHLSSLKCSFWSFVFFNKHCCRGCGWVSSSACRSSVRPSDSPFIHLFVRLPINVIERQQGCDAILVVEKLFVYMAVLLNTKYQPSWVVEKNSILFLILRLKENLHIICLFSFDWIWFSFVLWLIFIGNLLRLGMDVLCTQERIENLNISLSHFYLIPK